MEKQAAKKNSNFITKEEKMEGIIASIINNFKTEIMSLPTMNNSEFNIEVTMSNALRYLFVLFQYLEKNLETPKHYSIDFFKWFGRLAEKLEFIKDFEKDKKIVFGEIGEDNE